jgi:undecaprenyl-diphosphatase
MFLKSNKNYLIVFTTSLIVYLLSCFGIFDDFSEYTAKTLYYNLGYTNEWSFSYGPQWFAEIIKNLTALGSREVVLLFSVFMYFYLLRSRGKSDASKFVFIIGLGIVLILITKSITSKSSDVTFDAVVTETLSYFPSGHAFMTTVLYLSLAQFSTVRHKDEKKSKYMFVSASIVVLLVGVSLFMGSGHTVTEVIAGWSYGLCWYTFAQMFLRLDHRTTLSK